MPTAPTWCGREKPSTRSTMVSSTSRTSCPSVGRRSTATTVPVGSTTAPSTLVPPMSIPTVSGSHREARGRRGSTSDMRSGYPAPPFLTRLAAACGALGLKSAHCDRLHRWVRRRHPPLVEEVALRPSRNPVTVPEAPDTSPGLETALTRLLDQRDRSAPLRPSRNHHPPLVEEVALRPSRNPATMPEAPDTSPGLQTALARLLDQRAGRLSRRRLRASSTNDAG